MDESGSGTPSLKYRLKKTICCCFASSSSSSSGESSSAAIIGFRLTPTTPRLLRTSSHWIKSRSNEFPEFRDRCRNFISRIGNKKHRRRRSQSADFRYDPLSYSLNFEAIGDLDTYPDDEYLPLRNFTARLPQSPVRLTSRLSAPAVPQISSLNPVADFTRLQRTTSDGAVVERRVGISREITACNR